MWLLQMTLFSSFCRNEILFIFKYCDVNSSYLEAFWKLSLFYPCLLHFFPTIFSIFLWVVSSSCLRLNLFLYPCLPYFFPHFFRLFLIELHFIFLLQFRKSFFICIVFLFLFFFLPTSNFLCLLLNEFDFSLFFYQPFNSNNAFLTVDCLINCYMTIQVLFKSCKSEARL